MRVLPGFSLAPGLGVFPVPPGMPALVSGLVLSPRVRGLRIPPSPVFGGVSRTHPSVRSPLLHCHFCLAASDAAFKISCELAAKTN